MNPRQQAEQVTGPIDWINDYEGFIVCPGDDLHSNRSGPRDCKVYLDKVPTIFCVHQSCSEPVATLNLELRRALGDHGHITLTLGGNALATGVSSASLPVISPRNRQEYLRRRSRERNLRAAATKRLEQILNEPRLTWEPDQILHDSPLAPGDEPHEDWHLFLTLFDGLEGCLWCGAVTDSGQEHHQNNFKHPDEWMLHEKPPHQFTCSSLFGGNTRSRSNLNVVSRPFLVMESDILLKGQMGAVLKWFTTVAHWRLRAIIDTGGKSLHGWFEMPPQEWLPELQVTLDAMQMDASMLKPSQPVRLPGAPRGNAYQRLIYYDPALKSF